ncbi:MAG: protein-glutamate O-methyltransferase CheR [Sulfurimonas sp.]|nr:protein-glutamate O-methyltransferase CheR [Sulfurimonas sp.]
MFSFFNKELLQDNNQKLQIVEDYVDIVPISKYFKEETGVTFEKQINILKSKVTTYCKQREIYSFTELLNLVKKDSIAKQKLIDYLTTNETFFYREFKQITELVNLVKTINSNINILCAPSATGEEPYSIVIALLEAGVMPKSFHITGIDINSDALEKAHNAVYRERNVRNLTSQIIKNYFLHNGTHYILKDVVKIHTTFKLENLFDPSFKSLGKFDFVFSRNMLIYFDKETKLKAKNILESMRKDNRYDVFFGHADIL